MRNLTVPEACLLVGTAVLGSAAFLGLEMARLEARARVVEAPAASVEEPVPVALPEATPPSVSLPSSPPLHAPEASEPRANPKKKHRPARPPVKRTHEEPVLDPACEDSDDPLCGQL
jgi:outer membrane biosynthesis protein TonB